jgi:hypothetical protein
MLTSELRRGNIVAKIDRSNYVHIPIYNIPFVIEGIDAFEVEVYRLGENPVQTKEFFKFSNNDICGIPLTEEWLLRLGVNRQTSNHHTVYHNDRVLFQLYNGALVIEGISMPLKLEYVHQLQNLYFALTGEELIPNPAYKDSETRQQGSTS